MRYLRLLFILSVLTFSCDDGDVITVQLEFDGVLERCDNYVDEYVLFDEISDPNESLNLVIPKDSLIALRFVTPIPEDNPYIFSIEDDPSVRFLYRTYGSDPSFCNTLDDGDLNITNNYEAPSGTVELSTSILDFDDDGIPSAIEDANLDGDNDPTTNPTDRDGDGFPDYIDQDDDNDNVPTDLENPDPNGDGDVSDAQDTDGDGTPDYLDTDDDGDGVPTILEDANSDSRPENDFDLESPNQNTPRYLDNQATEVFEGGALRFNIYTRQYTSKFVVNQVNLEIIYYERLDFGTFITEETISNESDD